MVQITSTKKAGQLVHTKHVDSLFMRIKKTDGLIILSDWEKKIR